MTELEKEFFKAITSKDYDSEFAEWGNTFKGTPYEIQETRAKASAALCESKMREAIELARRGLEEVNGLYTEQEILNQLNLK